MNSGIKRDKITVFKTKDPYDVIKLINTHSKTNAPSNRQIIDKLKEWDKISEFRIIGIGSNFVYGLFSKKPVNVHQFVGELVKFCPSVIEDGTLLNENAVEKIVIGENNILYLVWD